MARKQNVPQIAKGQRYEIVPIDSIQPHPRNTNQGDVGAICQSLDENDFFGTIVVQASTGYIVVGNHRWKSAKAKHMADVPVVFIDIDDERALRILLVDNRTAELASQDENALIDLLRELADTESGLAGTGYDGDDLDELIAALGVDPDPTNPGGGTDPAAAKKTLAERFGVPPFSVLDAKQGYWQDRKRAWLALGIQSEKGRDGAGLGATAAQGQQDYEYMQGRGADDGGSIFDPVLCEIAYRWFCPAGGKVIDPFAGGSVRGIVAAALGRSYVGCDLRAEQVSANHEQWADIFEAHRDWLQDRGYRSRPIWHQGDSAKIGDIVTGLYDMLLTCPPYLFLEQYSDDPADLSNMSPAAFYAAYRKIIESACKLLRDDSFAVIVVGDVRDKKTGAYLNFVGETIDAFQEAGLSLYNEAVYLTPLGTMPIRAGKAFDSGRKLCKGHQNVLVFCKGSAKKAVDKLERKVEFGDMEADTDII